MASIQFMLLLLSILLVHISGGFSLECYHCMELQDPECKDPFTGNVQTIPCDEPEVCVKHETLEEITIPGFTMRGCVSADYCDSVNITAENCFVCTTDLCNSTRTMLPSIILIAMGVVNYVMRN